MSGKDLSIDFNSRNMMTANDTIPSSLRGPKEAGEERPFPKANLITPFSSHFKCVLCSIIQGISPILSGESIEVAAGALWV